MEKDLIYAVLGEYNQHVLACRVAQLQEIYEELNRIINYNRLDDLYVQSFIPMRIRDVPEVLSNIYNRFKDELEKQSINDENVIEFIKTFDILKGIVKELKDSVEHQNNVGITNNTYKLGDFFKNYEFEIEDPEC